MLGIGPGSILGGRYTADQRTAEYAGAERWTGRDTTLERAVVLFTVPRSHPNVDAVLDAARRSAGLDNTRLSRILDVGSDEDVAYVVEEALEGAHSLAELLSKGPLPAPEVRRIAGETALVLDLARHRGLHHQRLTPDLVMRTSDGDVKVRGLATMAALMGVDDVDDRNAARADAKSVVAIAYAGFTGHWPLPGDRGGLPAAPRMASRVAAPSEIAAGVPADLDALCRLTFANDQGPINPGDFARQIAPWSPIPVLLPTLEAPEQSDVSTSRALDERPLAVGVGSGVAAHREREDDQPEPTGSELATGVDTPDLDNPDIDTPRAEKPDLETPGAETPHVGAEPHHGPTSPTAGTPGSAAGRRDSSDAAGAPAPPPGVPVAHRVPTPPTAGSKGKGPTDDDPAPGGPSQPSGPGQVAAMTAATTAAIGSAGAATAQAAKALSGRLGELSTTTRARAQSAVADLRAKREDALAARAAAAASRPPEDSAEATEYASEAHPDSDVTTEVGRRDRTDLEPPVPLLPASAAEPLTRDQSRMAIGIVVGFLVFVTILALWGLPRIPSVTVSGGEDTVATAPPTESTPTGGEAETEAPVVNAPLTFVAATDFDPLGDGAESPEALGNILDGDDATAWTSEGYRSSSFSGLKSGLGIVLDLGESSSVSEVTLVLPSQSAGSIFVTDDAEYAAGGKPLAEDLTAAGSFDGSDSVSVTLTEGTSGRFVIVWFTEISSGGEQWYRARLAGAAATS